VLVRPDRVLLPDKIHVLPQGLDPLDEAALKPTVAIYGRRHRMVAGDELTMDLVKLGAVLLVRASYCR
jgi:hypothetical protein